MGERVGALVERLDREAVARVEAGQARAVKRAADQARVEELGEQMVTLSAWWDRRDAQDAERGAASEEAAIARHERVAVLLGEVLEVLGGLPEACTAPWRSSS
ncbi:hypothetical protein [Streptomyces sp. NPDC085479]|uniref:hypothetical protein n=1 Tax=Streptomyces sp. NPDC085479 TaxID=3365726 RepID=UPI0037D47E5E